MCSNTVDKNRALQNRALIYREKESEETREEEEDSGMEERGSVAVTLWGRGAEGILAS